MQLEVLADPDAVARQAAEFIAGEARTTIAERGRFVLAVSGGHTPWQMLRHLASEELPWEAIYFAQVDERIAPTGHADRNLTHLQESLAAQPRIGPRQILAMPVEADPLEAAAARYSASLQSISGVPATIDLAHLGLGPDGHTASLVPGDAVLKVADRDVALTSLYQGRRRMTLTYPMLNRARRVLWLVTGSSKREMLPRLLAGDTAIPAGRVRQDRAIVLADRDAAG